MKQLFLALAIMFVASSCYSVKYNVGNGPQGKGTVQAKNHFLIYGLAPLNENDPAKLAGEATDYQVEIVHTFVDGLLNAITFGIYTPTTMIVRK